MQPVVPSMEKRLNTILTGLMVIGISWSVGATVTNQREAAQQSVTLASMQKQLDSLDAKMDSQYRTTDAGRDFALRDALISDLRSRLSDNEKRTRDLEDTINSRLTGRGR